MSRRLSVPAMIMAAGIIGGLAVFFTASGSPGTAFARQEPGPPVVCIDPGHGGRDPGAVNTRYGLYESHLNLDVAYRLRALLEGAGYRVEMTRTDDTFMGRFDRYPYCNRVGADILVSIHANGYTNTYYDGTLVYFYYEDDRPLAQAIHDRLYSAMSGNPPVTWRFVDLGIRRFYAGIIVCSDVPAVIVEPVFLSHNDEAILLLDTGEASRRQVIARAIFDGIQDYFASGVWGSANTPRNACPYTFSSAGASR